MKQYFNFAVGAAVFLMCSVAVGEGRKYQFDGTGNTTTREFKVDGPWILTWSLSSDFQKAIAFDMSLVDALTRAHVGRVVPRKGWSTGQRLFRESGRFRFRIDSSYATWHIRIREITEAEASEYLPVTK